MTKTTDWNDAALVAAAALPLAREIAPLLRRDLPARLGRMDAGLTVLATWLERGELLSDRVRSALESALARVEGLVEAGTGTEPVIERDSSLGEVVLSIRYEAVRTPEAEELARFATLLRRLVAHVDRVRDLQRAEDAVMRLQRCHR